MVYGKDGRPGRILRWALAAGLALLATAGSARADSFADGFDADVDQNGVPDGWAPVYDSTWRRWGRIVFPDTAGPQAGAACMRIACAGAPAALELVRPIPVSTRRSYRLTGWTRATGLARGRASFAVLWLDAAGRALGEVETLGVSGPHPWRRHDLELEHPPEGARAARLQCRVADGDLGAHVGFDTLEWVEGVRLEVAAGGRAGHLFFEGDTAQVRVSAWDLEPGSPAVELAMEGEGGATTRSAARVGADGRLDVVVPLPLRHLGRGVLRVTVEGKEGPVASRRIALGVLAREGGEGPAAADAGGLDLVGAGHRPAGLAEMARLWGAGAVRLPVAPGGSGDNGGSSAVGPVTAADAGLLAEPDWERIGLLAEPGTAAGTAPVGVLRAGRDRLDAIEIAWSGRVADRAETLGRAEAVRTIAPGRRLGLSSPADDGAGAALAAALGSDSLLSFDLPGDATGDLAAAAGRVPEVHAVLHPETEEVDAGTWVRRACVARAAGARRIFLGALSAPAGPLFDRDGLPTEVFFGTRLLGREEAGADLSDGTVFEQPGLREFAFVHPDRVDLVCWREGETGALAIPAGGRVRVYDAAGRRLATGGTSGGARTLPDGAGPFLLFGLPPESVRSRLHLELTEGIAGVAAPVSVREATIENGYGTAIEELTIVATAGGRIDGPVPARLGPGEHARIAVTLDVGLQAAGTGVRVRVAGRLGPRRFAATRAWPIEGVRGLTAALVVRRGDGGAAVSGVIENRTGRRLILRAYFAVPGRAPQERALGAVETGAALAVELPLPAAPEPGRPVPVALREVGGGVQLEVEAK